VAYSNLRLTVVEMDKKRIARVRLERLPAEPNAAEL
jgi:CBS domain containing-hemolysin-like protein